MVAYYLCCCSVQVVLRDSHQGVMYSAVDNCKPVDVADTPVQLAHGIDCYNQVLEVAYIQLGALVVEAAHMQVELLVAEAAYMQIGVLFVEAAHMHAEAAH